MKKPSERDLDAALREWPDPPRSERYWEDLAARIEARVEKGDRGRSLKDVTDANLLAPPLPWIAEEGHNSAASGERSDGAHVTGATDRGPESAPAKEPRMGTQLRDRDRRSFQDLAKLAAPSSGKPLSNSRVRSLEPGSAEKDDSGLIDLQALAKSDPGAIDRASVTPLAPFAEEETAPPSATPSSEAVSQPLSSQVAPAIAPRPATPAAATLRSAAPPAPEAKRGGAGRTAMILGLAAIAAGAFVAVRVMNKPAPVASAPAPTETVAIAQPTAVAAAPIAAKDPTPAAPQAATPAPQAAPEPQALAKDEPRAAKGAAPKPNGHAAASPTKEAKAAKPSDEIPPALAAAMAADTSAPPKVASKDLPASPPAKGGLSDAIKSSVGPAATPEAATTPAAAPVAPVGSVPQRPSQGAVTGALGAVIPDARGCLGPDDLVSRAHVVFGSNGSVQSVTITGFAAGKPMEACIKGALGKAKVPPFAEATFGATVTIRP